MNNERPAAHLSSRLAGWFAGPHLPAWLVVLVLAAIAGHAALILTSQPAAYWLDPRFIDQSWYTPTLLAGGAWIFCAAVIIYLLAMGVLLARLNQYKSLVLAGGLLFIHLYYLSRITFCQFPPFIWSNQFVMCGVFPVGEYLVWGLLFVAAITVLQSPTSNTFGRRWLPRASYLLAAVWLGLLGVGILRSATLPASGWQPLAPKNSPPARRGMGIAYDTARKRAVLFGGQTINANGDYILKSDTWEWDGENWQEIHTDSTPPPRWLPSMAYDEATGMVVMFGGIGQSGLLSDIWEYDGSQWIKRCPVCNPSARWGATMLYDPQIGKVILYGGSSGGLGAEQSRWLPEAWTWNGSQWESYNFSSSSPAAANPGMVYESSQNRILAFLDLEYGGTWIWQDGLWTKPTLDQQPPYASGAALVYDPLFERAILYGGVQGPNSTYNNQTWVFERNTWQKLNTPLSPTPRDYQAAFYDPTWDSMIVFGGWSVHGEFLNDTWELPLENQQAGQP